MIVRDDDFLFSTNVGL